MPRLVQLTQADITEICNDFTQFPFCELSLSVISPDGTNCKLFLLNVDFYVISRSGPGFGMKGYNRAEIEQELVGYSAPRKE